MRNTMQLVALSMVVGLLTIVLAPAAEACCRPCRGLCKPFVDPATICCTGVSEPGNACGQTTCGEWKPGKPGKPERPSAESGREPQPAEVCQPAEESDATPVRETCPSEPEAEQPAD